MPSNGSVNDAILQPFLMAQDVTESQRELLILLSEHAEPRMRGIILSRLGSNLASNGRFSDYEDLCSEVRTKLVIYLDELKANLRDASCIDFCGYVSAVAHNACHDYFRQLYPARARLQKRIRDLLHTHPNFAIWKSNEDGAADWVCGFEYWLGRQSSSNTPAWMGRFYENPENAVEALAEGIDIQSIEIERLVGSLFTHLREPVRFSDLVDLVADIRGIRDLPVTSLEGEDGIGDDLRDSKIGIDSVLELRECLTRAWKVLREMPRNDFKAYMLYARDGSGENLINLFLHVEVTTEEEVALLLDVSPEEFTDLLFHRLPLGNEEIAEQLGIPLDRLYKRRYRAGKRLKTLLS
jgi:RNA polymerase sigma factor (sigma-70 family)